MAYKLIISERFEKDLDSILNYISYRLYNPSAANRMLCKTEEVISRIVENPLLYPLYHTDEFEKKGYHYVVVANYLLFYQVDTTTEEIRIVRLLYGRQNLIGKL